MILHTCIYCEISCRTADAKKQHEEVCAKNRITDKARIETKLSQNKA